MFFNNKRYNSNNKFEYFPTFLFASFCEEILKNEDFMKEVALYTLALASI